MKTASAFILALAFSGNTFAGGLDELVSKLCLSPSQAGKYWDFKVDGNAGVNGIIRLFSAGINGEATLTKGEWEGVQQVLKSHQVIDNKSFRECAIALTPLLLPTFAPVTPAAKPKPKPAQKSNHAPLPKPEPAKTEGVHQEIHGDKNIIIYSTGGGIKNVTTQ